jgi:hypothetical protein
MDSANFWPLRPTIGGCRESSVFRYLTDLNTEFPYVYQKALSLVLASKRFAKKQQMQWTRNGAHLLIQTRTRTSDGTLRSAFERWYPGMASNNSDQAGQAHAA